jgi:hypothetical protein
MCAVMISTYGIGHAAADGGEMITSAPVAVGVCGAPKSPRPHRAVAHHCAGARIHVPGAAQAVSKTTFLEE